MDPKEESNMSEDDTRNDDFSDMAEELDKDEKTGFPKFYDLDVSFLILSIYCIILESASHPSFSMEGCPKYFFWT